MSVEVVVSSVVVWSFPYRISIVTVVVVTVTVTFSGVVAIVVVTVVVMIAVGVPVASFLYSFLVAVTIDFVVAVFPVGIIIIATTAAVGWYCAIIVGCCCVVPIVIIGGVLSRSIISSISVKAYMLEVRWFCQKSECFGRLQEFFSTYRSDSLVQYN